jgi:signal recognition particle receptor subunit beta
MTQELITSSVIEMLKNRYKAEKAHAIDKIQHVLSDANTRQQMSTKALANYIDSQLNKVNEADNKLTTLDSVFQYESENNNENADK